MQVIQTGTRWDAKVLPKVCTTAAEVRQLALDIAAKRRADRAPKFEEQRAPKPPVNIVTEQGTVLPAWVSDLQNEGTSNVIQGDFVVVRPYAVLMGYPRIKDIIAIVADFYKVTELDILSARRTANIVRPRQVAAYLARTMTLKSMPEIGRRMGNKDHTTILYAYRKMERLYSADESLAEEIDVLRLKITDLVKQPNDDACEVPFTA